MSVILQRLNGASSKKLQQTSMKPEHTRLGSLKAGSKHSLHTAHIPKQHGSSNDPRQKGVWSWWTFKRFRYQGQFNFDAIRKIKFTKSEQLCTLSIPSNFPVVLY
jgi:hypothetical protein